MKTRTGLKGGGLKNENDTVVAAAGGRPKPGLPVRTGLKAGRLSLNASETVVRPRRGTRRKG